MRTRPALQLFPSHDAYFPILKAFKDGKPLSMQQLHFLRQHRTQLSNPHFDPVLRYYGLYHAPGSFLFPDSKLTPQHLLRCKKRLQLALIGANQGVEFELPLDQFQQFKNLAALDLKQLWHIPGAYPQAPIPGEPFLIPGQPYLHMGMPILPPGSPVFEIDYFEWQNMLGIVRYETNTNTLGKVYIHFEALKQNLLSEQLNAYLARLNPLPPNITPELTPAIEAPRLVHSLHRGPSFGTW